MRNLAYICVSSAGRAEYMLQLTTTATLPNDGNEKAVTTSVGPPIFFFFVVRMSKDLPQIAVTIIFDK